MIFDLALLNGRLQITLYAITGIEQQKAVQTEMAYHLYVEYQLYIICTVFHVYRVTDLRIVLFCLVL